MLYGVVHCPVGIADDNVLQKERHVALKFDWHNDQHLSFRQPPPDQTCYSN